MIKCIRTIRGIKKNQIVTVHAENSVYICLKNKHNCSAVLPRWNFKEYFEVKEEILLTFEL